MDVTQWMFEELQAQINTLSTRVDKVERRTERAETVGGVPSYVYASAPRAAQGGMSDGTAHIDMVWISNGRKAAEGVGAGTGQLCYYDRLLDDYRRVRDDTQVTV